MISLSSGLLQFVSSANLVTPDSTGSSATSNNGLSQLSAMYDQLQSTAKSQASTSTSSSSSSARLANDTYTPSTLSLIGQSFSASSKASSSSTASATSSSQGSQGDTVTLANLVKNQTISGSLAVRQVLENSIDYSDYSAVNTAWFDIGTKATAGDYSGALQDLTDYTTALSSLHYDTSLIKNSIDTMRNALQTGNQANMQAAYDSFADNTTSGLLSVQNIGFSGDVEGYATEASMVIPALTDQLQKIGYTAENAAAEANAIVLGIMVDDATIHVTTLGAPSDEISNHQNVDQSISDLAKAAAGSSDGSLMSSIFASLADKNSVTAMESTLAQLDSKYGTAAQGTGADNASQVSVSA